MCENFLNILFEFYQGGFFIFYIKFDDVRFVYCIWVKVYFSFEFKFFFCVIKVFILGYNVFVGILGWISYKKNKEMFLKFNLIFM